MTLPWIVGQRVDVPRGDRQQQPPACANSRSATQLHLMFRRSAENENNNNNNNTDDQINQQQRQYQQQAAAAAARVMSARFCPHLGYWYQTSLLDNDQQLLDQVESDILVAKKLSPHPFLLNHIDSQVLHQQRQQAGQGGGGSSNNGNGAGASFLVHVTEFCAGGSLRDFLFDRVQQREEEEGGRGGENFLLPLRVVSRIVQQLLQAVQHLHRHGVVHNAISLHNIFLDAESNVRLGNFSFCSVVSNSENGSSCNSNNTTVSRRLPPFAVRDANRQVRPQEQQSQCATTSACSSSSSSSCSFCSFCVAPPEHRQQRQQQTTNSTTTTASDIFCCGVVCYELLFGAPPQLQPEAGPRRRETSLAMRLALTLTPLRSAVVAAKNAAAAAAPGGGAAAARSHGDDEHDEFDDAVAYSDVTTDFADQDEARSAERLCRFLLLALSTNPRQRPSADECLRGCF